MGGMVALLRHFSVVMGGMGGGMVAALVVWLVMQRKISRRIKNRHCVFWRVNSWRRDFQKSM